MLRRLLFILIGVSLLVVLAAQVLLPQIASNAVAQGMTELTGSSQVQASVVKQPAIGMLAGSFDQITVDAVSAKLDKITFQHLRAVLRDVQLDRERLYLRRAVVLERVREVELTAEITQDEIARYLNSNVKGIKNAAVAIDKGKMQATSSFSLGGFATVSVSLEGRIISDGQRIKFVTERILLNNSPVGSIGGAVLTEIELLDLKKLPFGVVVRDIVLEQGKLTLFADNKAKP